MDGLELGGGESHVNSRRVTFNCEGAYENVTDWPWETPTMGLSTNFSNKPLKTTLRIRGKKERERERERERESTCLCVRERKRERERERGGGGGYLSKLKTRSLTFPTRVSFGREGKSFS